MSGSRECVMRMNSYKSPLESSWRSLSNYFFQRFSDFTFFTLSMIAYERASVLARSEHILHRRLSEFSLRWAVFVQWIGCRKRVYLFYSLQPSVVPSSKAK